MIMGSNSEMSDPPRRKVGKFIERHHTDPKYPPHLSFSPNSIAHPLKCVRNMLSLFHLKEQ